MNQTSYSFQMSQRHNYTFVSTVISRGSCSMWNYTWKRCTKSSFEVNKNWFVNVGSLKCLQNSKTSFSIWYEEEKLNYVESNVRYFLLAAKITCSIFVFSVGTKYAGSVERVPKNFWRPYDVLVWFKRHKTSFNVSRYNLTMFDLKLKFYLYSRSPIKATVKYSLFVRYFVRPCREWFKL